MTKKQSTPTNERYRQSIQIPKHITTTGRILQKVSPTMAEKYAEKLFSTPLRYKMPKREYHMDQNSRQTKLQVPGLEKEIVVYEYGESSRKVLLVHGWSGRGTQMFKIADALVESGFSTISFDAPAHGKAKGKSTSMLEFIKSAQFLEEQYGPFEYAIGHSLGGMTLLNTVAAGMNIKKLVIIGSGDLVSDIALDFTKKMKMNDSIADYLQTRFNERVQGDINEYSGSMAAKRVHIPVMLIHDKHDVDVPLSAAKNIDNSLKDSVLHITEGLGHRKILGAPESIEKINEFLR